MRKGENPWDSKPSSSSCGRDGGLAGRMDPPQTPGMGIFCKEKKKCQCQNPPSPRWLIHPSGGQRRGDPFPPGPPATPRLLPLRSIPRAGGWEQLSES